MYWLLAALAYDAIVIILCDGFLLPWPGGFFAGSVLLAMPLLALIIALAVWSVKHRKYWLLTGPTTPQEKYRWGAENVPWPTIRQIVSHPWVWIPTIDLTTDISRDQYFELTRQFAQLFTSAAAAFAVLAVRFAVFIVIASHMRA